MGTRRIVLRAGLLFVAAFLVGAPLWAQSKTQAVSVTNFPATQDVAGSVEVTNLPAVQEVSIVGGAAASCEVKRIQLVGFTSAVYSGNLGGVLGATRKCQEEFGSSRMCTFAEIQDTLTIPSGLPSGISAWMEPLTTSCSTRIVVDGIVVSDPASWSCGPGVVCMSAFGKVAEATGSIPFIQRSCLEERPIACCAPVP